MNFKNVKNAATKYFKYFVVTAINSMFLIVKNINQVRGNWQLIFGPVELTLVFFTLHLIFSPK